MPPPPVAPVQMPPPAVEVIDLSGSDFTDGFHTLTQSEYEEVCTTIVLYSYSIVVLQWKKEREEQDKAFLESLKFDQEKVIKDVNCAYSFHIRSFYTEVDSERH
jgi:hypothetical protein